MARYLVTGGAGFIGSNIVRALCVAGNEVVVLDDFSTGKRHNLHGFDGDFKLIEGSISDMTCCRHAVTGVECVLHQAALASVPRSVEDPWTTHQVNVDGTLNLLLASRDAGVRRFVFAASSAAYGNQDAPVKSEDLPPNPLSPYAIQKLTCEYYCQVFWQLYGLGTVALRYFNVFGAHQDPNSQYAAVVPKFITAYLAGEAPVIDGDGEQSRDFTHIDNVVHANLLAAHAPDAALGRVYNIACGEKISVNNLATVIRDYLGSTIAPIHGAARSGDVKHSLADLTLARQFLGYAPVTSFRDGMEQTIAWYKAHG